MFNFVFSMPLWAIALLLNVWLIGFALLGLWAFRRWALPRIKIGDDADLFYSTAVLQAAMMLYALVAALTAVNVWNRHSHVADIASLEATAINSLWRDLSGYPEAERAALQGTLREYTAQVINVAWPAQAQGRVPQEGIEIMTRFQSQLMRFEPALESHKILHAETLGAFNALIEARRQRLDAVDDNLPVVMWFVLLPGAMGCIFLAFFFRLRDARYQAVVTSGLAGFMAMVLFVIIALDHPFEGAMAIKPHSYQLVYDQLMKP